MFAPKDGAHITFPIFSLCIRGGSAPCVGLTSMCAPRSIGTVCDSLCILISSSSSGGAVGV